MADRLRVLLEGGAFFEGPRWHEGRLWVSDFYRQRSSTVDAAAATRRCWRSRSALRPRLAARRLAARRLDARPPDPAPRGRTASVSEHADLSARTAAGTSTTWSSTREGRAYVGNFGFDLMGGADPAPAALVRVDPDGTATVVAEDLLFPNGSVITPDGRTLIVGETAGARYTAFTIGDGRRAHRPPRVGAGRARAGDRHAGRDARAAAVAPDGCALDAEGDLGRRRARRALLPRRRGRRDRRGDRRARASASSPACSAATTAARSDVRRADFAEHDRSRRARPCCSRPPSTCRTPGCPESRQRGAARTGAERLR